jgi:hypothetical protein
MNESALSFLVNRSIIVDSATTFFLALVHRRTHDLCLGPNRGLDRPRLDWETISPSLHLLYCAHQN